MPVVSLNFAHNSTLTVYLKGYLGNLLFFCHHAYSSRVLKYTFIISKFANVFLLYWATGVQMSMSVCR